MRHVIYRTLVLAALVTGAFAQNIASTPPMGWNSWDAYGLTITEDQFKANVDALAKLKQDGWTYAVIDEGWYMANPFGAKLAERQYQLDANGLLIPDLKRFPSADNNAGLKPVGDYVHSLGLKFGVHVVRGIPKDAVEANLPIAGSSFRASEAADKGDLCGWDDGNYGVRDNAAGQAYYDSMVKQYADWGVDYIKIDCIADHPYKPTEIRQVSEAIKHSGREMVLSLSPGPTNISHAAEVGRLSNMWRISNDIWDGWHFPINPATDGFPSGIDTAFVNLARWHPYAKPGNWPDADMLPFGSLTPHPGWGEPRESRLSVDEERTMFTLWAIGRSPLILGGNLTMLPDHTRALITNKNIIAVNQTAWESAPVSDLPKGFEKARVWLALSGPRGKPVRTVAVFNLDDKPATLRAAWKQLGIKAHAARDLWTGKRIGTLLVTLPAHGSAIYQVE